MSTDPAWGRVRPAIAEEQVEERMADLSELHSRMLAALREWEGRPDAAPTADSVCALIEIFDRDA